ncbi:MAG: TonB-dependent receptor, partial [Alphaproteobacteria bacterium]|nr:TonB-dependent receptor [Alphaproteobacteria bacterium]
MPFKKLLGTSVLAMGAASMLHAQNATDNGDIIVTAAKRDQSLQSVPISVSVTNADTIQKAQIVDLIDLQSVVPSLKVIQLNNTSQTQFQIRGFADGNGNLGLENAVGLFVDGVYRSRSISSLDDLPDVERIEVLRGPQSTLFGKNVSVGAISITTKEPELNHWGGVAEATIGNYGEILTKALINAPIGDKVALRVSGSVEQRDGYFNDIVTGGTVNNRNRYQVRGDLLIKPSDDLKIRIIADYSHINEICCGVVNIFNGPASAAIQKIGGQVSGPQDISTHQVVYNFDPTNLIRNQGISGKIDYNLGGSGIKLTSIT